MAAVPVVHEQVHERASRQQQPRQNAKHVCRVLSNNEESSDGEKADQNYAGWRFQKAFLRRAILA